MNDNRKMIVVLSSIVLILFTITLTTAPYKYTITEEPFHRNFQAMLNSTSFGFTWGGDFENATVSWSTNTTNASIYFAINGYNSTWFNSTDNSGSVFLNRTYFLEYPYVVNRGGTWWRGVHTYIRPENGQAFNFILSIDGFILRHDTNTIAQQVSRLLIYWVGGVVWVFIVIVMTRPEVELEQ